MTNKEDLSDWITVNEARQVHFENTPRKTPVHRSAVYRWAHDADSPVQARWFGSELYIGRRSLIAFCKGDGEDC